MLDEVSPAWLDKTGFGVIGEFTLNNGERVTAEIIGYEEDTNEIVVEPLAIADTRANGDQTRFRIAIDSIVSFAPEPHSSHVWPHSDPCQMMGFSLSRFTLLASLFLGSTAGSLILFVMLMNGQPYRLQELSAVCYTLAVLWLTFAAHRNAPRFLFSCPAVKSRLPMLLWRHIGFLLALFLIQTTALAVRLQLSTWWGSEDSKGGTPFETVLLLLCLSLGLAEVYSSRSILKRAHSDLRQVS